MPDARLNETTGDPAEACKDETALRPLRASPALDPGRGTIRIQRRGWYGVFLLTATSVFLSTWGLSWGLPGVTSWAPDTVAGTRTLRTVGTWPDHWPSPYPPFHFFLNRLAYHPFLTRWQDNGQMLWAQRPLNQFAPLTPGRPGDPGVQPIFAPPVSEKIGRLILVSRWITVVMELVAVLAVAACGYRLFHDGWSGLLAGLTLATGAEWVYFSHLGNLDIPHMCWFALSLYAYIRLVQSDYWWSYALLGLFTALAVATKDAIAGAYVGMVVVIIAVRVGRLRPSSRRSLRTLVAVADRKMGLGFVSFAVPYAAIQGLFTSADAYRVYLTRLKYFLVGPGTTAFNQAYEGPLWLLREALAESVKALGWPMFVTMLAATLWGLLRRPRQSLLLLLPCLGYYLIVCQSTGLAYARILFPIYMGLSLLVGRGWADGLTRLRAWPVLRYAPMILVYAASIGYCAAVDLEMVHDTRYRAEQWLRDRVAPQDMIGVFSHPQYLPRFFTTGHRARLLPMKARPILSAKMPYLLLTSHNYEDFTDQERDCLTALRTGTLGYPSIPRASFTKRYLPPRRRWFSVAGWATRGAGKVSPDITILERRKGS